MGTDQRQGHKLYLKHIKQSYLANTAEKRQSFHR